MGGDNSNNPTCEGLDLKIHNVYLNASDDKCLSLAAEMDKDPMMQALKHQIVKGWPHIRSECGKSLQDFWNYRDELSVLDGLVLKRFMYSDTSSYVEMRFLINYMKATLDVDRTKLHARDSVYWSQYK